MSFLKNGEIKRLSIVLLLLTVAFYCIGLFISPYAGVLVMIMAIVFSAVFLFYTKRRYEELSELSLTLDRILHSEETITLDDNKEGELAILNSELKKMTLRLREQSEALRKEKKYLADSIADIAHQLRTPLTSINLIVSFLQEKDLDEEERLKLAKEMTQLLSRIDWLITALLKISKIDAGTAEFKLEKISVDKLIQRAAEPLLIPMELREQSLVFEGEKDASFVGDLGWTTEAVGNIIKNCMEHTPPKGRLEIETRENAIYTEIVIRDNGSGIEKDDLPFLFQRFYKGKNSKAASVGIGLALARMIIQEQNGSIKAENNIDQGAKFTVRFYKKTIV